MSSFSPLRLETYIVSDRFNDGGRINFMIGRWCGIGWQFIHREHRTLSVLVFLLSSDPPGSRKYFIWTVIWMLVGSSLIGSAWYISTADRS